MKYPEGHKQAVGKRLRREAATQLRDRGIERTSVKSVMAAQGMTVGGFYAHFESRKDMLAEAIRCAFADSRLFHEKMLAQAGEPKWLSKAIAAYLSPAHRDQRETSCPVACLTGEMTLADESLRQVYEQQLLDLSSLYEQRLTEIGVDRAETLTMPLLSLLSGALQLSRAVSDEKLSQRILGDSLKAARQLLETT